MSVLTLDLAAVGGGRLVLGPGRGLLVERAHHQTCPERRQAGLEREKVVRIRDGQALTFTSSSRNTAGHLQLLELIADADPDATYT